MRDKGLGMSKKWAFFLDILFPLSPDFYLEMRGNSQKA
jgi:hypothetical protein